MNIPLFTNSAGYNCQVLSMRTLDTWQRIYRCRQLALKSANDNRTGAAKTTTDDNGSKNNHETDNFAPTMVTAAAET